MPPTNQGQNLINPVMVSLPLSGGRPAGFYKSIVIDGLNIIAAFVLGCSYYEYLVVGISPWFIVVSLLVFGTISALQSFLCKKARRRAFVIACEVVALSSPFYLVDWRFLLAAATAAFVLFFWGYLGSRSEIEYAMDIRPFKATKSTIAKVTTGTILFMIVIYIPLWNQSGVFISQKNFDAFFNWGAGVINTFYPNLPLSGSMGDLTKNAAHTQLESTAAFQSLSPQNQNMLIAQGAKSIIDSISKSIGVNIQPSESISATVYQFIVKTLAGWENRFQGAFFVGWGVVLFFVARSVGIIFIWINQFFFLIIYESLLASRFMRVKQEPRTKEIIEY